MKTEILYLCQEDVIRAGVLDMPMILEEAERTLKMWARKELENPTKVGMVLPDPEHEEVFFIAMPAYVGGDTDRAGFKWAAESRHNGGGTGIPRGIDIAILSDTKTALPVAIMEASLITAMRTSASAGIGAKYLARKNTEKACFAGAGIIGRTILMAMTEAVPSLKEIKIYDLNLEKAESLAEEYRGSVRVTPVSDLERAAAEADLVVTMTSTRTPFLEADWLKKDATVIQMGPNELKEEVILGADTLIVDNWQQLTHSKLSVIRRLFEEGRLKKEDATELRYVVNGDRKGRKIEAERVVYCSLGLGAMDIAIADRLYRNAEKAGIGQSLKFWDKPLWI